MPQAPRIARMPMRKARDVEELLKGIDNLHPIARGIIVDQQERLRIQNQQLMMLAQFTNTLMTRFGEVLNHLGYRDDMLKKLGIEEMLKGDASDMVKSIDIQDDGPDDTQSRD